jgi:hypothetical protein
MLVQAAALTGEDARNVPAIPPLPDPAGPDSVMLAFSFLAVLLLVPPARPAGPCSSAAAAGRPGENGCSPGRQIGLPSTPGPLLDRDLERSPWQSRRHPGVLPGLARPDAPPARPGLPRRSDPAVAAAASRIARETLLRRQRGLRYSAQSWHLLRTSMGAGGGKSQPRAAPTRQLEVRLRGPGHAASQALSRANTHCRARTARSARSKWWSRRSPARHRFGILRAATGPWMCAPPAAAGRPEPELLILLVMACLRRF